MRRTRVPGGAVLVRSPSLRSYAWREEPEATKSRKTATRGAQHHARRPGANSGQAAPKAPRGLEPGRGCAIAGREAGRRAAHLLSKEGVPDWGKLHRVTAVRLKQSRRASANRNSAHRDKARPGIAKDCDRNVRGTVARRSWVGLTRSHGTYAIRRSDSIRRETYRSPVSMGGILSSTRPMKSR